MIFVLCFKKIRFYNMFIRSHVQEITAFSRLCKLSCLFNTFFLYFVLSFKRIYLIKLHSFIQNKIFQFLRVKFPAFSQSFIYMQNRLQKKCEYLPTLIGQWTLNVTFSTLDDWIYFDRKQVLFRNSFWFVSSDS